MQVRYSVGYQTTGQLFSFPFAIRLFVTVTKNSWHLQVLFATN